jgi:transcriptional regulator with XRE-family HTH domain
VSDPLADFGAAVRARRLQLGWSQEQLALNANLDRTYVSGVERGVRNPTLLSMQRLAASMNVSLSELLR